MLDSFTQFWFSHLDSIVNVLFLVLILLFMVLFVVIFISSKNKKDSEIHSDDLEKTLRKVLESAELKSAPMPMPSGNSDVSGEASEEVSSLKKSFDAKVAEVESLKKQIAEKQSSGGGSTEEASGLQLRLKELEAKLAEYEVIEDDIANLSMYKEENKRLRSELDKLGGDAATEEEEITDETVNEITSDDIEAEDNGSDEEITSDDVAEDPPVEEVAQVEEEIVPEPAAIAEKEKTEAPKVEAATPEETTTEATSGNEDDILGEFVQAVAEQGTKENPKTPPIDAPEAVSSEPEEKIETKANAPVEDENAKADDIMAEFEAAAARVNTKSTEPTAETKDEVSPLEESTDTDKILNEMDSLLSAEKAPEADDDTDPTEKLIGEFESLTKTNT